MNWLKLHKILNPPYDVFMVHLEQDNGVLQHGHSTGLGLLFQALYGRALLANPFFAFEKATALYQTFFHGIPYAHCLVVILCPKI